MNEFQTINVNLSNLSEEERKQLLELVKKSNKSPKKRWRAQGDEKYYFIDSKGYIDSLKETNHTIDEHFYKVGNYFKTSEEAKFELNRRLVYQELKDYALEHNETDVDWSNPKSYKWFITYFYDEVGGVFTDFTCHCQGLGQIYFDSQKIACDAIQSVGENRIKKYLFNID